MIRLENLCKTYFVNGAHTTVADNINAVFPDKTSVALLGRNGAGKSSLLRMVAGTMNPSSGQVKFTGTISWSVGFAGSFHPDLSGAQNTRFVARIYGVDSDLLIDYVKDFSELKYHFNLPVRTYSSGMRARLAFGVSMGIQFDTYLVDEVTAVGDAAFREKCVSVFKDRMKDSGAIVVSHSMPVIRSMCSAGAVLENGKLKYFDDLEEAITEHNRNMQV
ncbi:MAG: ABC transporter ATP-binding protein [Proteobacteria bacterium]|nr:ABC transporter ATP-binding protein [Pseudomonadota bacterium]